MCLIVYSNCLYIIRYAAAITTKAFAIFGGGFGLENWKYSLDLRQRCFFDMHI